MVLCASENEKAKVEFLLPPETADLGDRILLPDSDDDVPMTPNQVKKKKVWPSIQEKLAIVDGVATYDGSNLVVGDDPCTAPTIQSGNIS